MKISIEFQIEYRFRSSGPADNLLCYHAFRIRHARKMSCSLLILVPSRTSCKLSPRLLTNVQASTMFNFYLYYTLLDGR